MAASQLSMLGLLEMARSQGRVVDLHLLHQTCHLSPYSGDPYYFDYELEAACEVVRIGC